MFKALAIPAVAGAILLFTAPGQVSAQPQCRTYGGPATYAAPSYSYANPDYKYPYSGYSGTYSAPAYRDYRNGYGSNFASRDRGDDRRELKQYREHLRRDREWLQRQREQDRDRWRR